MSYIIYVCDTETTGLLEENDVIELSLLRLTLDKPEEFDQKTWCLRALNPQSITDKALSVNGHKREDITHMTKYGRETYLEPSDAISEIEGWIMEDGVSVDDRVLAGQNTEFDYNMLKSLWKKSGNENTFPFNKFMLDTIALARLIDVCMGRKRDRYNLGNLIKDFGITKRQAHRAADDVLMTKDLLLAILLPMKDNIIDLFKNSYRDE